MTSRHAPSSDAYYASHGLPSVRFAVDLAYECARRSVRAPRDATEIRSLELAHNSDARAASMALQRRRSA